MFSFFHVFFNRLFLIERRKEKQERQMLEILHMTGKEEQERQMLEMLHMAGPPGRVGHFGSE
jgi:hypothetical protein